MCGLGTLKCKSISKNLLNVRRDQHSKAYSLLTSFPASFCARLLHFPCSQPLSDTGVGRRSRALGPPHCPVLPPRCVGGRARRTALCGRTHLEGPLDASRALPGSLPAPQPCSAAGWAAPRPPPSGAAAGPAAGQRGRRHRQPEGYVGNPCEEWGSGACCLRCLNGDTGSFGLGLRSFPRMLPELQEW